MNSILDFAIAPFYTVGIAIWRFMLGLIGVSASQTPEAFSSGTWSYVTVDLYPMFAAVGATMLNLFFYIGYVRQAGNLKQEMTLEIFVEMCIKVIFGNALVQSSVLLTKAIYASSGNMAGLILSGTDYPFQQEDIDGGAVFYYLVLGIVFFAVCLVCSATVFLTCYGRFLQLYMLVLAAPPALATIAGGGGFSQTAASWFKTTLSKAFSIVFIALAITIASKICNGIDFAQVGIEAVNGGIQMLNNMCTMIIMTASVKGTDAFMRRTFGL